MLFSCVIVWFFSWREVSSFCGRTFAAWLEPGQQNCVKLHKARGGCLSAGLRSVVLVSVEHGGHREGLTVFGSIQHPKASSRLLFSLARRTMGFPGAMDSHRCVTITACAQKRLKGSGGSFLCVPAGSERRSWWGSVEHAAPRSLWCAQDTAARGPCPLTTSRAVVTYRSPNENSSSGGN